MGERAVIALSTALKGSPEPLARVDPPFTRALDGGYLMVPRTDGGVAAFHLAGDAALQSVGSPVVVVPLLGHVGQLLAGLRVVLEQLLVEALLLHHQLVELLDLQVESPEFLVHLLHEVVLGLEWDVREDSSEELRFHLQLLLQISLLSTRLAQFPLSPVQSEHQIVVLGLQVGG